METFDLACRDSFSLTENTVCQTYTKGNLYLGSGFQTYLFFELPHAAAFRQVREAKLVLFKIPFPGMEISPASRCGRYCVWTLLDFFSPYGNYYAPPRYDGGLCVCYQDRASLAYTEIDVTKIVSAWLEAKPENKGLLLTAAPGSRFLVYASGRHKVPGMHPLLRLYCEGVSQPLSEAPCTVSVRNESGLPDAIRQESFRAHGK